MVGRAKYTVCLVLGLVGFCSCSHNGEERFFRLEQNDFFPLKKGNFWSYSTGYPGQFMIVQVVGYEEINKEWYARVRRDFTRHGQVKGSFVEFWRPGEGGAVVRLPAAWISEAEKASDVYSTDYLSRLRSVYYHTKATEGDKWQATFEDVGARFHFLDRSVMYMGNVDSLEVPCGTMRTCLRFRIGTEGHFQMEFLAKGVGLVRLDAGDMGSFQLCSYALN
jgi:hypothetical protein